MWQLPALEDLGTKKPGTFLTRSAVCETVPEIAHSATDLAMKPWDRVGGIGDRWVRSVADGTVH
jgi:hypothetical protein